MKRVRLTALAEFDLVEAQDFYAQSGEWVLDHFMDCLNEAFAGGVIGPVRLLWIFQPTAGRPEVGPYLPC